MEEILIPYVKKTGMDNLKVRLQSGKIAISDIKRVLGVRATPAEAVIASVGGVLEETLTIGQLDAWLIALPGKGPVLKHMRENLAAAIRAKSIDLKAQDALQDAAREAAYAAGAVLVSEELTGSDRFRKDASRGFERMMPDVIDYTAQTGSLDLFVRGHSEVMWGETFTPEIRHVPVAIGDDYNEHTLGDMRRANELVLTGPQISAKMPEVLQAQRRYVPERASVRIRNGKPQTVVIPRHPEVFPWEMAVMQGAKDAKAVELPGSPYNGKRPFWIDD